jgi:hypothetical protein
LLISAYYKTLIYCLENNLESALFHRRLKRGAKI